MSRPRYTRMGPDGYATTESARPAPAEPESRPERPAEPPMSVEDMAASLAEDDEFQAMVHGELRGRWTGR
jgi:hypothetical protein